jgi:hypothetical protein
MARKRLKGLLEFPPEWEADWEGMPEFKSYDKTAYDSAIVNFRDREAKEKFFRLLGEKPGDCPKRRQILWYPREEVVCYNRGKTFSPAPRNHWPIYVISKGRWERKARLTSRALDSLSIPHRLVVEPQEADAYAAEVGRERLLVLPFSNLGQGSIPARNWVWEHSVSEGWARHWILDDNIRGFWRLNNNLKLKVVDENPFSPVERFVGRYENVALAGLNYFMFAPRKTKQPPYYLNTRIYSCILIDNSLDLRWRGRYNEDTDLSLRALKAGWVTVLFNAWLAEKTTTMTMRGGNTDELYKQDEAMDGRRLMAESLKEQHPDVTTVTYKWGRWQHHVDYRPFRRNKLREKGGK